MKQLPNGSRVARTVSGWPIPRWPPATALAGLTLLALVASGAGAVAQEAARETTGRDARVTSIQDPRLEADSTLFPYEWPALNEMHRTLIELRAPFEAGDLARLAEELPAVEADVERLLADTVPTLLQPRQQELRGRMVALQDALRRARELTEAALAAPPPPAGDREMLVIPLDRERETAAVESGNEDAAVDLEAPLEFEMDTGAAEDSLAAVGEDTAALEEPDPIEAYLDGWRDAFFQAEMLLHRVRDPTGP